jgi:hypothetical protein
MQRGQAEILHQAAEVFSTVATHRVQQGELGPYSTPLALREPQGPHDALWKNE